MRSIIGRAKNAYRFSKIGDLIKKYDSARIAAEELGISRTTIQFIFDGKYRKDTAGGFRWSYYSDGRNDIT